MIPAAFAYSRPASVDEALRLLASPEGGAKVLAGGQSLLPLLKLRLAQADRLIDIGRLDELRGIRETADGGVTIGALTTYRTALESAVLRERYPAFAEAIEDVADVQVRNVGTLGGAIAHADPASDLPAIALAYDAQLVLRSTRGERVVAADGFCRGAFTTDCRADELLTEIRLPAPPTGAGAAYRHLEQPASGYSMVGVAAVLGHRHGAFGASTIDHVRVAVTGVADAAYRARAIEDALTGTACSPQDLAAAAAHVVDGVTVGSDIHADAEYRGAMAVVYARRALEAARARSA